MTYVINKTPTFLDVFKKAIPQRVQCTDDCHEHRAHTLLVWSLIYRGHKVGVVLDGDYYSAQIDGDPKTNQGPMSFEETITYVEELVKEKNNESS